MAKHPAEADRAVDWLVVYGSLMRGLPARETAATHRARTSASGAAAPSAAVGADVEPDAPGAGSGPAADEPRLEARDLLDELGVAAGLRRVGPCRVPGRLFDLGPYPALRPAGDRAERVCGELHALLDPGVFAVLDAFEGFDPADPARSDYRRERITLLEPAGVVAWIYVFNREPEPAQRVPSGDWRAHLAKRGASPHDPEQRLDGRGTARWDS